MPEESHRLSATQTEWDRIAATRQFRELMTSKKVFIVPAFLLFLAYYFALPVLVGLAPRVMSRRAIGGPNLAYVFALSQFFVAWFIAWRYLKVAGKFDQRAKEIVERAEDSQGVDRAPGESRRLLLP